MGRFIGYDTTTKGYRIYIPARNAVIVSRHVEFDETRFTLNTVEHPLPEPQARHRKRPRESTRDTVPGRPLRLPINRYTPLRVKPLSDSGGHRGGSAVSGSNCSPGSPTAIPDAYAVHPTSSQASGRMNTAAEQSASRAGTPTVQTQDGWRGAMTRTRSRLSGITPGPGLTAFVVSQMREPLTYEEAINSPDAELWKEAIGKELNSHASNGTWALVDRPAGRNIVTNKWVFKIKRNADGTVERYKARLVARGFTQVEGEDFVDTFAPVVPMKTLRSFIATAAKRNYLVHQMDVETAYLNGVLREEIFMTIPKGVSGTHLDGKVCKLQKSLYGLRQAGRRWYETLTEYLIHIGFQQARSDPCMFTRTNCLLTIYVDDIMIAAKNESCMNRLKSELSARFKMKDLGTCHFILGIHVEISEERINLHQRKYTEDLLQTFGMKDANPVATPLEYTQRLCSEGVSKPLGTEEQRLYRGIVGKLQYLAVATRPDIAFAVGMLGRFCHAPNESHMGAAKRVLRYLRGAMDLGISFSRGQTPDALIAQSDADFKGDLDTRKSTSGHVLKFAGGPIDWHSKRQTVITTSTFEAELTSAFRTVQDLEWTRRLLSDLGCTIPLPITLHCDNQAMVLNLNSSVRNPVKSATIDLYLAYIREKIEDELIQVQFIAGSQNDADIFTKAQKPARFLEARDHLLTEHK